VANFLQNPKLLLLVEEDLLSLHVPKVGIFCPTPVLVIRPDLYLVCFDAGLVSLNRPTCKSIRELFASCANPITELVRIDTFAYAMPVESVTSMLFKVV